jgi:hypothetical protein
MEEGDPSSSSEEAIQGEASAASTSQKVTHSGQQSGDIGKLICISKYLLGPFVS